MGNARLEDALDWSWEFILLHQYIHFIIAHFRHSLVAYTRFSHTFDVTVCQPFAATGHKMYLVWQIVWDMFLRTAASLQPSVTPISKPPPTPHPGRRLCQRSNATCDGASLIYLHTKAQTCIKNTHTHSQQSTKTRTAFATPLFDATFSSMGWAAVAKWSAHWGSGRCGLQGAMRHLRVNKKYILNQKSEKCEK